MLKKLSENGWGLVIEILLFMAMVGVVIAVGTIILNDWEQRNTAALQAVRAEATTTTETNIIQEANQARLERQAELIRRVKSGDIEALIELLFGGTAGDVGMPGRMPGSP